MIQILINLSVMYISDVCEMLVFTLEQAISLFMGFHG